MNTIDIIVLILADAKIACPHNSEIGCITSGASRGARAGSTDVEAGGALLESIVEVPCSAEAGHGCGRHISIFCSVAGCAVDSVIASRAGI